MKTLVIGYGNELRQDDGVGPRVARIVAGWNRQGLEAIAVHQLTPELAEPVSRAERVVFVDAVQGQEAATRRLDLDAAPAWSHAAHPQGLLALAEVLYQRRPEAWLLQVPAAALDFGEELSAAARRGMVKSLAQLRELADLEGSVPAGSGGDDAGAASRESDS